MKALLRYYRVLNLLSIDVMTGAMVCAAFFARILEIHLLPYGLASLGLAVWIIYSVDHLLDARQLKATASTNRHQFHQRNFKAIRLWVFVAMALDLVMILYIRKPIFFWGLGLAAIILLYLLFQRLLTPFKELIGALLYSFGVLLPALSLHTTALSAVSILLMATFILTALTNMVLFSWFDLERDLKDTQLSVVTFLGHHNSKRLLWTMFVVQFALLAGIQSMSPVTAESLTLVAMNLVLMVLFVFPERFAKEDGYRLAGDAIFLFPLPYLLFHA